MAAVTLLLLAGAGVAQQKRYVVIDQDAAGPGGTDMMSILVLLQSPEVQTLGITVVTGDQWRDVEVAHTQRLLELVGRPDIPVAPGAVYPLVRTQAETKLWEQQYGKVTYQGAWTRRESNHDPAEVPPMAEGKPTKLPLNEDAAHFLVRTVREHPHEVTVYAGGPMTNLALALSLDPHFAELSKGLGIHGRQSEPADRRPGIRQRSAARIQPVVRPRGGPHRAARALAVDCLHDRGCIGEDAVEPGDVRSDRLNADPRGAVSGPLLAPGAQLPVG
jgi:hypothetical protein